MKTRAAICWEAHGDWVIEDVELDEPGEGEVLVKMAYAGLCHSDEHIRLGDFDAPPEWGLDIRSTPMVGGHEGAGVVEAVGPGVTGLKVGDHVATSFVASCGVCPPCATGHQNLCDLGAEIMSSPNRKHHVKGHDVNAMAKLGTFADYMTVDERSLVRVENWYPLDAVALVSCGVATGWGSAVNTADISPGDTVVVIGVGGIGINAVQGAAHAGASTIIAVDPVEMKREFAQTVGATHIAASMEEAMPLLGELSWGRMANSVILTVSTATGDLFLPAMAMVGKGGSLTVTSIAPMAQTDVQINMLDLAMSQKQIRGTVFGSCNPRADIPKLLRLYEQGKLELDRLITGRYTLDQINQGYADMHAGKNVRGVIDLTS